MTTQQPTKTPVAPPEAPALDDENTYVLHAPQDQRHVRALLGASRAKAVTELRMARLTDRHKVASVVQNALGAYVLTDAVPVRDHWIREGDDGRANERTFIRALGKVSLPWHIKFRRDTEDDLGTIRLGEC